MQKLSTTLPKPSKKPGLSPFSYLSKYSNGIATLTKIGMAPFFQRVWMGVPLCSFIQQPNSYSTISETGRPEFSFFLIGFKPPSHFLDYPHLLLEHLSVAPDCSRQEGEGIERIQLSMVISGYSI